jgi:trigger factor
LDDDFAKEATDDEYETLAAWREAIEKDLRDRAQETTDNAILYALEMELVKANPQELPETMVQKEITSLLTDSAMQLERMGVNLKDFFTPDRVQELRESSKERAIDMLSRRLITEKIIEQENITADETAVNERMEDLTKKFADEQSLDFDRLREVVEQELAEKKLLEWLKENNKVELVPVGTLEPEEEDEEENDESESE